MVEENAASAETTTEAKEHKPARWDGQRWVKWVLEQERPITPPDLTAPPSTATPRPAIQSNETGDGTQPAPQTAAGPKADRVLGRFIPPLHVVIQPVKKLWTEIVGLEQQLHRRRNRPRQTIKH